MYIYKFLVLCRKRLIILEAYILSCVSTDTGLDQTLYTLCSCNHKNKNANVNATQNRIG